MRLPNIKIGVNRTLAFSQAIGVVFTYKSLSNRKLHNILQTLRKDRVEPLFPSDGK